MNIIEIKGISKKYKNKTALNNINLSIKKGELIGLIGSNGSGKSTLIKCIGGLVIPTSGVIDFPEYGKNFKDKLSILLEGADNIYHFLSVMDNIKYFMLLNKIEYNTKIKEIMELLEMFSLTAYKNTMVNQLSRGMQQKVAILIAILKNPEVLILDEPTLGLDLISTINMKLFLKELVEKYQKTIIICSHDLSVINEICERIIVLNNSEILFDGSIDEFVCEKDKEYIIYYYISADEIISPDFVKVDNYIYKYNTTNLNETIKLFSNYEIIKVETNNNFEEKLKEYYDKNLEV